MFLYMLITFQIKLIKCKLEIFLLDTELKEDPVPKQNILVFPFLIISFKTSSCQLQAHFRLEVKDIQRLFSGQITTWLDRKSAIWVLPLLLQSKSNTHLHDLLVQSHEGRSVFIMGTIFFFFQSGLVTEPILITIEIEVFQDCLGDTEADLIFFDSNLAHQVTEPLHVLEFEALTSLIDQEAKTWPQGYICILIQYFMKFAPIFEVEQFV